MKQITKLIHPIAEKEELLDMMLDKIKEGNFTDLTKDTLYIDKDMIQTLMKPIFDKLKINFIVNSAWIHFMMPGSNQDTGHNHPYDVGVYYLQVNEKSGNLFFNDLNMEITPKVGLFLIVPAKVIHSMKKNKSNKIRIAMGMELHQ